MFHNLYRDDDLPLIVAIDLQPMAPIEGVIQVQGDITNARTAEVVCVFASLYFISSKQDQRQLDKLSMFIFVKGIYVFISSFMIGWYVFSGN